MPLPKGYQWTEKTKEFTEYNYNIPTRNEIKEDKASFDPTANWDWQNQDQMGPQGEALPEYAVGWQPNGEADFGAGPMGFFKKSWSNIKNAASVGYQEGIQLSGFDESALKLLKGEEQAAEQVKDINKSLTEKTSGVVGAGFGVVTEVVKSAVWGVLDGLGSVSVVAEQAIGSTAYAIADTIQGKDINWKRNWEASRLLYSGLFDANVFTEMERRLDAGMEGRFAAQELMINGTGKLWPELIGQVVFDPLNAIGLITKANKLVKMKKSVQAGFHVIDNPVVREFVEGAIDVSKLDDATAAVKLQELVKGQQGLSVAAAHADDIVTAEGKIDVLSKTFKMSTLTESAKLSHLADETSAILMHVVSNSDPEEGISILRAMIKSVDTNPNVAAQGIAEMMHFQDAASLFSRAGNDTTVMLAKMTEKYGATWLDDLDALKGDPEKLIGDLLGKLDDVGQEIFPSVDKMLDAEEAVKAAKSLDDVPKATQALADKAKLLPNYIRAHQKAQKVVGPVNKFFAGVYMGWSPGYAFRNWANNTTQILIDEGLGAVLNPLLTRTTVDATYDGIKALHGGWLPEMDAFGGAAGSLPDASSIAGKTDMKSLVTNIKQKTKLLGKDAAGPAQIAGATFELNGKKMVFSSSYKRTFENGTKAMIKALTPDLKAAGFSDDVIKRLPTYIMENKGDAKAVINAIRTDMKTGVVDMFGDLSRIDPKHKDLLEKYRLFDHYQNGVLKAGSKEESIAATNAIFDDLARRAEDVYSESRGAMSIDDSVIAQNMAGGKYDLPAPRGMAISYRQSINEDFIKAADNAMEEVDRAVERYIAQNGRVLDAPSLKKKYGINKPWSEGAVAEKHRLTDLMTEAKKKLKKGDFEGAREIAGEFYSAPFNAADEVDQFWTGYDDVVSRTWKIGRQEAAKGTFGYMDELKKLGVEIDDTLYKTLKEAEETAAEWDDAMVGWNPLTQKPEYIKEVRMPYGTRKSQIAQLAQEAGIATATPGGTPTDGHILNIIKKHAKVDYMSLEEVPMTVAKEAFDIRAGKLSPIKIVEETVQITKDASSPMYVLQQQGGLSVDEFEDIFGGTLGKDKQGVLPGLFQKKGTNTGMDIGEAAKTLQDAGLITADQAQDLSYVRDFIRKDFEKTTTFTRELRTGGQAGADASKAADEAAAIAKDTELGTMGHFNEAGDYVPADRPDRLLPPFQDGSAPGEGRSIYEQMDEISRMKKWMLDDIEKNFGKKQLVDKVAETGLRKAEKELAQKIAENRLISSRVAKESVDFTLLNYGDKTYGDLALAYLYPYHYWYKGTYKNWIKRIATNPQVLAHYQRYKENLGLVHADMPEWWRYNINSNDLPGVDTDNPMYFNLEATLWPLNGITGTDFNDASRRVDWWTKTLDFAGKFGPSIWSPINIMTGIALHARGEEEAGAKWMGRLFPQSATIKAVASKFGVDNLEVDPLVKMFSGNLDPYEENRVKRAMGMMAQEAEDGNSKWTPEQIQEAAYAQEGEIWDEAVKRAVHGRAGSQLWSFMLGVGFKGRTPEDMEIDKFYTDYGKVWGMKGALSTEEFKQGMAALQKKYPFMDTMLLSRRDDIERDAGLAYVVMQRIPPGQMTDIANAVDVDPALLDKFFTDKGQIDQWSLSDRTKFMAGILTMSAVLSIPTDMTREEWASAKAAYSSMTTAAKDKFGDGILDSVDGYYQAKTISYEEAQNFLDKHPEVNEYMNWKAERVMGSPLLSAYYGGASMIEGYYRSQMYADIEKKLGKEVFDVIDTYNELKTYATEKETKSFYRQNKKSIEAYYDMKDGWYILIDQKVAELSSKIPEGQGATVRPDIDKTSPTQTTLADAVQPQQQMTYQDFQQEIPANVLNLVQDYIFNGKPIPYSIEKQLGRLAGNLGYANATDLIQGIGTSMYQAVSP